MAGSNMVKVQVRQASMQDQKGIVNLLEGFYPGVPHHWRKLFAHRPWQTEGDFPGFVIVDDEKIVGFLGTIFSEHEGAKGRTRLCNMTTWYVEPNYRQHSMVLFLKLMKLPNVSWTNFSAAPHLYECLTRTGFKTLEETQTYVIPIPKWRHKKSVKLLVDVSEQDLHPDLHHIYRQHAHLSCRHVLIQKGTEQCYCLIVLTRYKKLPLAKIYYLSNPALFREVLADIRMSLCLKLAVCYLVIEGDVLRNECILGSWTKKLYPPRLYKSSTLSKEDITLLCSELFVLGV